MKKLFLFPLLILLGAFFAQAADFSPWPYSMVLKLNTSASGANVSGTVTNFPLLVRLTPFNFDFDQANADGSDIRFSKNENPESATELTYQIERWDATNKVAEIWIKVPEILGNNASQAIKMYWGLAIPPNSPPTDPVFNNNYVGVWHLGENAGNTSAGFKDASPSVNHGTGVLLDGSSYVGGVAGKAAHFNGSNVSGSAQSITSQNNGASLHPTGQISIEFWVCENAQGQFKRLVSKAFTSGAAPWSEYDIETSVNSNTFALVLSIGGQAKWINSTTPVSIGQWYHVTATYNQSQMKIYVNGNLDSTKSQTGTINDYGRTVTLGKYEHDAASNFNGSLDEVRISNTARSGDWVKLSYMNQKSDQKLVELQSPTLFTGAPGVLYEEFAGIAGGNLTDLLASPLYPNTPSKTRVLQAFDGLRDQGTNYGVRMSGWLQAPETGNYSFWIAADDQAELRVSVDANPVNKVLVASVPSWTNPLEWTRHTQQHSANIQLVAGKLYFIEALMAQGSVGAHVSVGWTLPSGTNERPIPSGRMLLSPKDGDAFFPSTINLYEQGTSIKKATIGWHKESGNDYFYINTYGAHPHQIRIEDDVISTKDSVCVAKLRADVFVSTPKWKIVPDYVFDPEYKLPSLKATDKFVRENRHLPGIPSAKDIAEKGMDLGEMNLELLKQLEHMHLYMVQQEKRIESLEKAKEGK